MRALTSLLLLLSLAAPAAAGPLAPATDAHSATDHAVVARLDDGDLGVPLRPFVEPLELTLPRLPYDASPQAIDLRMEEPGPESLAIRVRVLPYLTLYVSADMRAELPRLDAVDGDTYFAPGVEFHLTPTLSLFVEDFQPASGVIGGGLEEEEPWIPPRSWDGHQIGVGVRWQLHARVRFEGAAVIYALSPSHRASDVGASWSVAFAF